MTYINSQKIGLKNLKNAGLLMKSRIAKAKQHTFSGDKIREKGKCRRNTSFIDDWEIFRLPEFLRE